LAIVSLFVCTQLAAGCGDDDDNSDEDAGSFAGNSSGSGGRGGTNEAGSGGRSGSGGTGGSTALDAGPDSSTMDGGQSDELDDEEILAVLKAANSGEIGLGMLALERSNLTIVRDFSQTMIEEHGEAQQRQDDIADRFGLEPDDNEISEALEEDVADQLEALQDAEVLEFDLLYAQAQVSAHDAVLKLIDDELLPNVVNSDLREELESVRTAVAHHLELARDLRDAIEDLDDTDGGIIDDDAGL
jgi:putative membrane protein